MLMRLLPVWGIHLPPIIATTEVPKVLEHLTDLLDLEETGAVKTMPADSFAFVRGLLPHAIRAVQQTAEGLYEMLARPGTDPRVKRHPVLGLSASTVAGALVLLALEGNARLPAPHIGELADAMAARTGGSGKTICARYRVILDEVEKGAAQVPWLEEAAAVGQGKRRSIKGVKKADGKRGVLARQMLDTVAYCQKAWRLRIESGGPVTVTIEPDEGGDNRLDEVPGSDFDLGVGSTPETDDVLVDLDVNASTVAPVTVDKGKKRQLDEIVLDSRRKRRQVSRADHRRAEDFLLDPFVERKLTSAAARRYAPSLELTSHFLAPSTVLDRVQSDPPTRLQLLSSARGGAGAVLDEELFADGELEGFLMSPEEVAAREPVMLRLFGSDWGEPREPPPTKEQKAAQRGMGRFNAEALGRVLGRQGDEDELTRELAGETGLDLLGVGENENEIEDDDRGEGPSHTGYGTGGDDDIEVMPYRPLSPSGGGRYDDRYDF
jgi:transcription factor IIIB subunit 2